MIKTKTIKKRIVVCDICGSDTGYDAEQGYAENKKHFCREHHDVEIIFDSLYRFPKIQELFFNESKEKYVKDLDTKTGSKKD